MTGRGSYRHLLTSFMPIAGLTGALVCLNIGPHAASYAQVESPPITPSVGLNTQISAPLAAAGGKTQYDITGGTRPNGGLNLFHSFGDFGVPTNNIANFLNETPAVATSNILGRVTGGNISNIFGTIQTTGFGNANLFLMNPAGFLFGPNATVNVGGMMTFTSADYLKLVDNARFNAIPNAAADALLTASPVASFGFLGSNPGAITVQGSQLSVSPEQSISLIGGNITVQSGTLDEDGTIQPAQLSAQSGQINLASVASPGEILYPSLQTAPNINGQSFASMGAITFSQGTTLDVSDDAAGTVRIRGGQFVIDNATISADTVNANGAPTAIDINVTGDLSITDTRGAPALTARTTGDGDGGEIQIASGNLTGSSSFLDPSFAPTTLIDSHTEGSGRAGTLTITTGTLNVQSLTDPRTNSFIFIDSGTRGPGRGGDVTITANINLDWTSISTGDFVARNLFLEPSGSAGNLTMAGDTLRLNNSILSTEAFAAFADTQQGGNLSFNVRDISMINGQIGTGGMFRGGSITVTNFDSLFIDFTHFDTFTVFGPGGGITANGRVIDLTNGSRFVTSTFGDGDAGGMSLTATDRISFMGHTPDEPNQVGIFSPSGLFSNSWGDVGLGNLGASGDLVLTTPNLVMAVGGRMNTITKSSGRAGNVTINADMVSISGEFSTEPHVIEGTIVDIGSVAPSGIFTSTIGREFCSGPCGVAGNIIANIGSLIMGPGAQIDNGTSSSGTGGLTTINVTNAITISGTLSNGDPVGIFSRTVGTTSDAGFGGNIALTAGQSFTISNGASVSASSTGPGNTGNIQIDAGNQFTMTNSTVTTEANQASGGAIKITTNPSGMVQLTNSTISASVLDGTGGGGSVDIDPLYVILLNSHFLANADEGPGGNITINISNGGLFLPDAASTVSASSQFGLNGTVTIQSPNAPASGKIQPLGKTPLQATSLLNQHCAALAGGEFSSFTVAGRDSLPIEPGSWLASPLAALSAGARRGARGEGLGTGEGLGVRGKGREGDLQLLSLRQLAPAGFLTQAFAVDGPTGCQS